MFINDVKNVKNDATIDVKQERRFKMNIKNVI